MALNASQLASMITNNINGQVISTTAPDGTTTSITLTGSEPETKEMANSIAKAVVDHILANLDIEVPSASFVVQVIGQATGTPNPGPVKCLVL